MPIINLAVATMSYGYLSIGSWFVPTPYQAGKEIGELIANVNLFQGTPIGVVLVLVPCYSDTSKLDSGRMRSSTLCRRYFARLRNEDGNPENVPVRHMVNGAAGGWKGIVCAESVTRGLVRDHPSMNMKIGTLVPGYVLSANLSL